MQSFSFAPPNSSLGENKKNYVFVDEHNRHKRLKVMRACEGCRKRKIKCDAATTNEWPCAACVRLKLQCVPPTASFDRAHSASGRLAGLERVLDFDNSSHSGDEDYAHTSVPLDFDLDGIYPAKHSQPGSFHEGLGSEFHTPPYSDGVPSHKEFTYDDIPIIPPEAFPDHHSLGSDNNTFQPLSSSQGPVWTGESSAVDLSSILGELKIDEDGVAPYISQQKKSLAEAPALVEDCDIKLPSLALSSGSTVRIPPELMPSEEQCIEWFEIFFTHVHPYVPVISKPVFYQQWRTNRKSISPLILEAIFACAGRISNKQAQASQWLALASKHEDCFMDVPRLSTIQALLLLLKAREAIPKRGYYYRSWMTIKTLITMAKDLDLHEHFDLHGAGRKCTSDLTECLIKTRIWQNIFICEIMVGGAQGRIDFHVDPETVDMTIPKLSHNIDPSDYQVSRQYTYMVRMIQFVRALHNLWRKNNRQTDFGADPKVAELNPKVLEWLNNLPSDFQVAFPEGDSPPWLPSHFVGNMHSYYHLLIIMLHRPQLMLCDSFSAGGNWKEHMIICYSSAKAMCRLQEGVLQSFGLPGLLCMQRGINFVIYAVLTSTMIHLVAITSPDPDLNKDAKDFFARHMRILEICTSAWPSPELQAQIDQLREAFSADTSKPFELKASFPYGSPISHVQPSPPLDMNYQPNHPSRPAFHEQTSRVQFHPQPMTPPISADHDRDGLLNGPALATMTSGQPLNILTDSNQLEANQPAWNPTRIFDQWNNAFGVSTNEIIANTIPQPSPPVYTQSPVGSHDLLPLHDIILPPEQPSQFSGPLTLTPTSLIQPLPPQQSYTSAGPSFVTSSMWRDTVASTYDPAGLKRPWDMESSLLINPVQAKRCR